MKKGDWSPGLETYRTEIQGFILNGSKNMKYYWIGMILYIIGVYISIHFQRSVNPWLCNFSYTPREIRRGLIWPILILIWLIQEIILILNDFLWMFLFAFNFEYRKTRLYILIRSICFKRI